MYGLLRVNPGSLWFSNISDPFLIHVFSVISGKFLPFDFGDLFLISVISVYQW
jgi:hypothetical protein